MLSGRIQGVSPNTDGRGGLRKNRVHHKPGHFLLHKIPFGLRNAGATYQRLVDKAFHGQIGRNLKVYVDDLVIKSRTEDEIVRDIEETFKTLRKINMKLNPKKCTFRVEEGMFLGYQVNTKGMKICPDKVDAVLSLQSPKCLKDVQKLNGINEEIASLKQRPRMRERRTHADREGQADVNFTLYDRAPRVSMKGQVLADFIVERPEEERKDDSAREEKPIPAWWTLFMDGSSCVDGCGAGVIRTRREWSSRTL
ncbi:reverse transcriptase domain-containing protein [Tanacetum coccineum]